MTSTEAAFSSTSKDQSGNLHTIRGGNYEEFAGNVVRALGDDAGSAYLAKFNSAFGGNAVASAVQNLEASGMTSGFIQATGPLVPYGPVPISTVGQPLPQPGAAPAAAAPQGLPPTVVHPGNCAHGQPYVYKDSVARGAPWRRFECSIPWSKEAVGRCKPVNI